MKKAIIVTNVTKTDEKFTEQVDLFVHEARELGIKLIKLTGDEVLPFVEKNARSIHFCLFWDKDTYLCKEIEMHGIPTFNSSKAIAICDDKAYTYLALKYADVLQPKTEVLPITFGRNIASYMEDIKGMVEQIGFPMVVKSRRGSFGEQVYLAESATDLTTIFARIGTDDLLIQEYIGVHPGEDFRINILGNKFAVGVRRYNKDDFRSNVNQGGKMYKAFINHKMRKAAIKATKAVGADFAGVDVVLGRLGKPYVIEVNSNMRTVAVEEASRYRLALKMMKYMLKKARKERKIIKLRVKAKEFI